MLVNLLLKQLRVVKKYVPNCKPVTFGHIGDGNIHFNITQPDYMDKDEYLKKWKNVNEIVFEIVDKLNGSFSAEHGIGKIKKEGT